MPEGIVALAGFLTQLSGAAASGPPMLLVSGSDDSASFGGRGAVTKLEAAGFAAEYVELERIDHSEIVDPGVAPEVVTMIMDRAAATAP